MDFLEACRKGNLEDVKIFLEIGRDANSRDRYENTVLMWASSMGHFEVVRLLLAHGANPLLTDSDGWTSLMYATWNGRFQIARTLLTHSTVIDAKNSHGESALTYALNKNSCRVTLLFHKHAHRLEEEEKELLQKMKYRCCLKNLTN